MKLTNIFPQIKTDSKVQVKKTQETATVDPKSISPTEGGDKVELSAGTKDAQKIKEILSETPEVRADKVEALKQQIEKGEYQVDAEQIADKLLMSLLTDFVTGD